MSNNNISLDLDYVKAQFPAFSDPKSAKWAFFENAGGSYVPFNVIEHLNHFMTSTKVQPYAEFDTSAIAGDKMDQAVIAYIRRNHNLLVGEGSAEKIKNHIGSACPPDDGNGREMEIKGRDLLNGVPKEIVINERQISESLAEPVGAIIEAVKNTLENTAPELAADIVEKGIMLTGGGAQLNNLDLVLRHATGLPVSIAEEPLTCVVLGTGRTLEEMRTLRQVLHSDY